ncbi:energy transducer TonB [Robertkochia solimangrovi]|uniref:energy transducer TonB n=1 Tax=Robertkochia solimangrovi TaxID=2213046 RepID=UPI00117D7104|nr:energy transducer TonB [Robertkochia solimangrovi]TRZ45780.1 hypothetical protein DMZ48_00435 [Robertkochia solimangrovi]
MKSFFKITPSHEGNRDSKYVRKHAVNLRNNSWFRFQIGLITSLLVIWLVLDYSFAAAKTIKPEHKEIREELKEYVMPNFTVEKEVKNEAPELKRQKASLSQELKIIEDDVAKQETTDLFIPEVNQEEVELDDVVYDEPEVDVGPLPIDMVEEAPVFPGCEMLTDNKERVACLSEQISKIVKKNFDTTIASDYNLTGMMRIYVQFKIDKNGDVTDVKVRSPHEALDEEARRVTAMIPKMTPGKQGSKDVDVIFVKPILFKVH